MNLWSGTWKDWWKRFVERGSGSGDGVSGADGTGRLRSFALLILLGVGLMMLGNTGGERDREAVGTGAAPANGLAAPAQSDYDDYVDELEREVTLAVTQIAGVGNVMVLIVPKTSEVSVLAEEVTERESESTGEERGEEGVVRREWSVTRRPIIVAAEDGRGEGPMLLYTKKPEIGGVLVAADGASDPRIRYLILKAVSTVLDLPPHKVEVVPKKM